MLNLLDAVAQPLPKDAALRRFIDDAADPLGTLLGYFVGGLDKGAGLHGTARHKPERIRPEPGFLAVA
jgi:hypothetical protein